MGSISLNSVGVIANIQLFQNLNFVVADGDRLGLIAGNGGGKTTLLRCLTGAMEASTGEVVRSRSLRLGYMTQDLPKSVAALTLREALRQALPEGQRDEESWRADMVLDEFEVPDELRARPLSGLSGGWQRLALLARVWITEPDALLLDEPTNHLDLGKLFWLEQWLGAAARNMAVIIASHDRDFLDATTNRTLFLRPETSHYFPLPYSRARAALDEADAAAEKKQTRDLREAGQLRRNAAKLTNIGINSGSDLLTIKAKQLKQRAARIEAAVPSLHKERSGDIRLANSGIAARVLIAIEDVAVATPTGLPLFKIGKLHLFQGDRVVLLGRNGAGKSLLVRMIRKAIAEPGAVPGLRTNPSLVVGYTDQDLSQLPLERSPLEFIGGFAASNQRLHALLAGAGVAIEKQDRPIAEFSFGQRARLALLALRLTEPNFYLMDEPTNHVDIMGQERLEEEILAHEASAVVVSHDRRFVRTIGTRFFEIAGKKLIEVDDPEEFFAAQRLGAGA